MFTFERLSTHCWTSTTFTSLSQCASKIEALLWVYLAKNPSATRIELNILNFNGNWNCLKMMRAKDIRLILKIRVHKGKNTLSEHFSRINSMYLGLKVSDRQRDAQISWIELSYARKWAKRQNEINCFSWMTDELSNFLLPMLFVQQPRLQNAWKYSHLKGYQLTARINDFLDL